MLVAPLVVAVASFLLVAVMLLLHHDWNHAHEDPDTSLAQRESCPEANVLLPTLGRLQIQDL